MEESKKVLEIVDEQVKLVKEGVHFVELSNQKWMCLFISYICVEGW